jgi:hypothetical protein
MLDACCLALCGWPRHYGDGRPVTPCTGFIESDYAPGTYYPCVTCNPNWTRVAAPELPFVAAGPPGSGQ